MEKHVGPVMSAVVGPFRKHVVGEVVRGVGLIEDGGAGVAMSYRAALVDVELGNKHILHQRR